MKKCIVISGAGRGFGRTCAIKLAEKGHTIVISSRNLEDVTRTKKELNEIGFSDIHAFQLDISNLDSIKHFHKSLTEITDRVDILINNGAGWLEGEDLISVSDEDVVDTITSGGMGGILLTKSLYPLLRNSESADVVNMISICGEVGSSVSSAHDSFYAAKHCLSGFSEIFSKRVRKDSIRVISLYPPDFNNLDPFSYEWDNTSSDNDILTSKSLWNCIDFALSQPRDCYIKKFEFEPIV